MRCTDDAFFLFRVGILMFLSLRSISHLFRLPLSVIFYCLHSFVSCSLQTGMRGAYGKPIGVVGRVLIGSKIMTIRTKPQNLVHANEALRRCKFKFPGRQNVVATTKWGFTRYETDVFKQLTEQNRIQKTGDHATVRVNKGPLSEDSVLIVKANHKAVAEEAQ